MYYNNTKSNIYFLPDLVLHLFLYLVTPYKCFFTHFWFYKMIVNSWFFSKVTFASELSSNLVYKSVFVIDYNYIFINLLFFFTVKLSIFCRLCVKHKRVMSRSTHTEVEKFYTDLKKTWYRYRQILRIFCYRFWKSGSHTFTTLKLLGLKLCAGDNELFCSQM